MEALSYPFFQRALVAAIILGACLPLLGVFVVSRRLSFYTEAVAHSAYTGLAVAALLTTPILPTVVLIAVITALSIAVTLKHTELPADTVIGVFLAISAALGIMILGLKEGYNPSLFQYLFGDILAIDRNDVLTIAILGAIIIVVMLCLWRPMVRLTIHRDMAKVTGTNVEFVDTAFLILVAVVVTLSLKLIGIVMVTAMFLLPTAAARNLSRSLTTMAILSVSIGFTSGIIGMFISYFTSTASGSCIVMTSAATFLLSLFVRR
ncbi:MAG: metal ABC transporter permease [Armatimonadota bacterium]